MSSITAKGMFQVLKHSGKMFMKDKVLKLSASLAFYTIFSLGPMLLVMIFFANLFWDQSAVENKLVEQVRGLIGETAADQTKKVISNTSVSKGSTITSIVSIIALVIGATTVFKEIQDSINYIWNLRLKKKTGLWKVVLSRFLSFSIVIGLGFILLVSLVINALLDGFMNQLQDTLGVTVNLIYVINIITTFVVTTLLFAIVYKVLPDAHLKWKDVLAGALFSTFLFMVSRYGISLYIGKSDIGSAYGAAGSIVVLLLWIYFSSMILYFGAEFTKAYAMKYGGEIKPNEYTVTIQRVEVESKKKSVQENEQNAEETQKQAQEQKDREKDEEE